LAQAFCFAAQVVFLVLLQVMNWPQLYGAPYNKLIWSFFPCLDATAPEKTPFVFQRDASDGMLQSDLYGLLGVTREATLPEIQKAGRGLMRIWHPDKLGETKPRLRYSWINVAINILTDEEARRFWDERLDRETARELAELEAKRQYDALVAARKKRRREQNTAPSEPVSPEGEPATTDPYGSPSDPPTQPLPKKKPRGSVGRMSEEIWATPKRRAPKRRAPKRRAPSRDPEQSATMGRAADAEPAGSPPEAPSSASFQATTAKAAASTPQEPETQKQQEEQRRRAEQPDRAASSSGAAVSAKGSSSGSTRVQWAASASSVWGASVPGVDIIEPVAETYHNFHTFNSFVDRYQEIHPDSDYVTNTFDFLSLVWPDALTSEIHAIEIALQLAVEGQCVRVPWVPIPDNDCPEDQPRITRQVPPSYGVAESLNFYHGTPVFNLPGVREHGLAPSDHGAGSSTPMLYTCKTRTAPLHTYSRHQELPIFQIDKKKVMSKYFCCVLGIGSLSQWPHAKKVPRRKYNQFLHKPNMYQVMWVEFICCDSVSYDRVTDPSLYSNRKKDARRVKRIAEAMIYPFEQDKVGQAPPKRVKLCQANLPGVSHNESVLPQGRSKQEDAVEDASSVPTPEPVRERSKASSHLGSAPSVPRSAHGHHAASSASSSHRPVAIGARAPSSPPPWRSNKRASSTADR